MKFSIIVSTRTWKQSLSDTKTGENILTFLAWTWLLTWGINLTCFYKIVFNWKKYRDSKIVITESLSLIIQVLWRLVNISKVMEKYVVSYGDGVIILLPCNTEEWTSVGTGLQHLTYIIYKSILLTKLWHTCGSVIYICQSIRSYLDASTHKINYMHHFVTCKEICKNTKVTHFPASVTYYTNYIHSASILRCYQP